MKLENTYTFDEKKLYHELNLNSNISKFQCSNKDSIFQYIWIPNNNGTISKINISTGTELARYIVWPSTNNPLPNNGPSRTAIDFNGNCWVANRGLGTVVKIGLFEENEYEDRNCNEKCDTFININNTFPINENDILPWPQDECVLKEIILFGDNAGSYTPGTFTSEYCDSIFPRSLVVDTDNNIWVGTYDTKKYYKIDGSTGSILSIIDLSNWNHSPYGAVIDNYGFLWSTSGPSADKISILKIDTITEKVVNEFSNLHGLIPYCITINNDNLFISGWTSNSLGKINIITDTLEWIYSKNMSLSNSRGIACTLDGDIWVANSGNDTVTRYNNEGTLKTIIPIGKSPIAIDVDINGNVWVCDLGDENIYRINPFTDKIDIIKKLNNTGGHYAYSNLTGLTSTNTSRINTCHINLDSKSINTTWKNINWNSSDLDGSSITIKARSSQDNLLWSQWFIIKNSKDITEIPNGEFLQLTIIIKMGSNNTFPILQQLTIVSEIDTQIENSNTIKQSLTFDLPIDNEIETILDIDSNISNNLAKNNNNSINQNHMPTRGIIF